MKKTCSTCQFYAIRRISDVGVCTLDPYAVEEQLTVEPTDSCDQWLEIDDLK